MLNEIRKTSKKDVHHKSEFSNIFWNILSVLKGHDDRVEQRRFRHNYFSV